MKWIAYVLTILLAIVPLISGAEPMSLTITSDAFANGGEIPGQYTCDGADHSPALHWEGVPAGTLSLVLVCDDPDASRKGGWVHWVLYDLPADSRGLTENVDALPAGTREGLNDWRRTGWGGPCPPSGRDRYFFKLYALDISLGDLGNPTRDRLEQVMNGHILGQAELMGTYQRRR